MTAPERAALPPMRWRMTWCNPVNGRVALYIASHAYAVEGLSDAEARTLLDELIGGHTASSSFTGTAGESATC